MSINLSGSLVLTGSLAVTGEITMSGSIASASYAANATSASFAGDTVLFANRASSTFANTGSNIFSDGQYVSSSYNPTGFSTTASLYTDGGLRVTRDAYVSGTLYLNNLTVFGTQSVAYISSSQLNIGTNLITVNTDTPSIRFGGLAVYDSGSTGLTGSIFWDSEQNHWIYSNPSGSTYSGGMFISGPRTSTLGSETGTTSCMLLAGQGGDHLTSSMIYHSSTATCFYGNSFISSSGAACFGSSITGTSATFSDTVTINKAAAISSLIIKGSSSTTGLWLYLNGLNATLSNQDNGSLAFQTNGTDRLTIASTGVASFASSVQSTDFRYTNTGYLTYDTANTGTECLVIRKNGTSVLTFNSNSSATFACQVCAPAAIFTGCVGIGQTTPAFGLEVYSSAQTAITSDNTFGANFNIIFNRNNTGSTINCFNLLADQNSAYIRTLNNYPINFVTNGQNRLLISNTGIACFSSTVCANAGLISNTLSISCNSGDDRAMYMSLNCSANYNSGTANTIARSVSSLKFLWYNNCWEIGATRGDDTAIQALVFAKNGSTYLAMTCHGIANFSCAVCAPRFQSDNYGIFRASSFRGGLFTYDGVTGSGTDYSPTIFAEGGAGGGNFYITTGGSATVNMAMFCSGVTCFRCQVCAPSMIPRVLSITTTALHGIKTFESGATSAFVINLPAEYPNLLLTGGNVWGVVGKATFFNGGAAEVRDFYIARNSGGSWSTANYGPSSNTSGGILQSVAGSGTCITINMNSSSYVTVELTAMVR